jgi:hypothetical protein
MVQIRAGFAPNQAHKRQSSLEAECKLSKTFDQPDQAHASSREMMAADKGRYGAYVQVKDHGHCPRGSFCAHIPCPFGNPVDEQ